MATGDAVKQLISAMGLTSRNRLMLLTSGTILLFAGMFACVFILPLNLFSQLPQSLQDLSGIIQSVGGTIVITFMLATWIFSSDELYYADPEKNRYVRAFQVYWPSKHIAERFDLNQEDADYYWFEKLFNIWADPEHPRHEQRERTFQRGYACRYVYYYLKLFVALFWVSAATTVLLEILTRLFGILAFESKVGLGWRIGFVVVVGFLYIILRCSNRTSLSNLTGVWRRYAEVNKLHIRWIDENIKSLGDFDKSAKQKENEG